MREGRVRDAQKRLGFIVSMGRRIGEKRGAETAQRNLREVEEALEQARWRIRHGDVVWITATRPGRTA